MSLLISAEQLSYCVRQLQIVNTPVSELKYLMKQRTLAARRNPYFYQHSYHSITINELAFSYISILCFTKLTYSKPTVVAWMLDESDQQQNGSFVIQDDDDAPELCYHLIVHKEIHIANQADHQKLMILLTAYNSCEKFVIMLTTSKPITSSIVQPQSISLTYKLPVWKEENISEESISVQKTKFMAMANEIHSKLIEVKEKMMKNQDYQALSMEFIKFVSGKLTKIYYPRKLELI